MKMRNLINISLSCVLSLVLFGIVSAQQGIVTLNNGIAVAIKTETTPASSSENAYGNIYSSSSKSVIHRIMTDRKNKTYFGYDLSVDRLEDSGKFKVSIKLLSKTPDILVRKTMVASGGNYETTATSKTGGSISKIYPTGSGEGRSGDVEIINAPNYKDYKAQPLPNYPDDLIIEDGDSITLELLENRSTNTKISDVITIMYESKNSGFVYSSGNSSGSTAKSFTIENVHLKMEKPDVFINGKKYKTGSSVAGNINWIYIKGKGRFIFSFEPQPRFDFQKIGIIQDNKISFELNGDKHEIVSKSLILGQAGKWNLWVMHDTAYRPTNEVSDDSPFIFGAADKVDYLFD